MIDVFVSKHKVWGSSHPIKPIKSCLLKYMSIHNRQFWDDHIGSHLEFQE